MITTEQVRAAAPGTAFGKWIRGHGWDPRLRRKVGAVELGVDCYDDALRWWIGNSHLAGDASTWVLAMAAAEESARKLFREALEELGEYETKGGE